MKGAIMYVGYWEKQMCLRDALIDDLVEQVELYKDMADAEINMAEVMRKELEGELLVNGTLRKMLVDVMFKKNAG